MDEKEGRGMALVDGDEDQDLTAVGSRAELAAALAKKARAQRPWLMIVSGGDNIGKMYRLEHQLVLGRAPQCEVQLDQDGVSRNHARLELTPEGNVQVVDLGSRNGTFVNGEAVSRETLRDGDKIQIGGTTILKFSYQDELDEACQRNLYESATRDPLTHAINRRGFEEALTKEYAFARRHGRALSLLAFDVDHFKRVNDTHGHPVGDYVLRRLAEIVGGSIRSEDVFARIGGEEFVVLIRDVAMGGAIECAERLRCAVERTVFETGGVRIPVTVSIGVATLQSALHSSPKALVESADRALYEAKHTGRNCVCAADAPIERVATPSGSIVSAS
jgi:two-component system, cell cycle response regulator